jgi:hypothetical protein
MSWNRGTSILLFVSLSGCSIQYAVAKEVCPSRLEHSLRFVDVFDGSPEELATLIPDVAHASSGYWRLGYVYDAGRFVTIRCKYDDRKEVEIKLPDKIARCDYKIDAQHVLSLNCK